MWWLPSNQVGTPCGVYVKNNRTMLHTQKQYINRTPTKIETKGVLREGQSLEEFLRKAMQGKEPIQATAKITYNDRKDGVLPQHDIRTDRFELAMMETDKIHATRAAQQRQQDFPTPEEIAALAATNGQQVGEA